MGFSTSLSETRENVCFETIFLWCDENKLHWTTASETSNTKDLELIKRGSKVQ